jgi:hypothetical protein
LEFKRLFETKASREKGDYVTFSNAALFWQQRICGAALFSWLDVFGMPLLASALNVVTIT